MFSGKMLNWAGLLKLAGEGSRGLAFHPVIPRHVSEVRLGAGEPATGARGFGCDIRPPQGLESSVVTSAPRSGYKAWVSGLVR